MDAVATQAKEDGWTVLWGRAFPVETGVPYAIFAEAFLPLLRDLEPQTLTVLSRGGERELAYLFPALAKGKPPPTPASGVEPGEFKTRLLWNFNELLGNLAGRNPLLLILEDLQWADDSSLELLHFIARQSDAQHLVVIATYNETERDRNPRLPTTERSLVSIGAATVKRLQTLSHADTAELVERTFNVDADVVREFCALLFGWTRGNPFFIEEVLNALVEGGRLHEREGTWLGRELRELTLPRSVRDAVLARVRRLSEDAADLAALLAVAGARTDYGLLAAASGLAEESLLAALVELRDRGIVTEDEWHGEVVYDFVHPLVRRTLYRELGKARARILHGRLATSMEAHFGSHSMDHVDELAYHFARTNERPLASKALRYLSAAGRRALERRADREAVRYLEAALERLEKAEEPGDGGDGRALRADLARAYGRLGEYEESLRIWDEVLESVGDSDIGTRATVLRYAGLASFWAGRGGEALNRLADGLDAAVRAGARAAEARIRIARGFCYHELGRGREALTELTSAITIAEELNDAPIRASAQRSLAALHVWISPPDLARRHLQEALDLAEEVQDPNVSFWAWWGLAVLEGLLAGRTDQMDTYLERASETAKQLRSPVLHLWVDEMVVERALAEGDWDSGVALAERAIALARALHQRLLLPRFLVLASMFYLGRGALVRGKDLVDEASELAGLGEDEESAGTASVHAVVPAYIGRAAFHLARGDFHEAITLGEKGLAVADGTGYTPWALHRTIPILAEAYLWVDDLAAAERLSARMRDHAARFGNRLADAWATTGESLVCWKRGDSAAGAVLMREAAEQLEAIPMVPVATRVRRQLAGRLAEIGDRDGALEQLRYVWDLFLRMGAERELEKTRLMFHEIDARPPKLRRPGTESELTSRELEVARLAARGLSNKGAAKELGIAHRTVSTHLSNIYQKLDLRGRMELAEYLRERGLLSG